MSSRSTFCSTGSKTDPSCFYFNCFSLCNLQYSITKVIGNNINEVHKYIGIFLLISFATIGSMRTIRNNIHGKLIIRVNSNFVGVSYFHPCKYLDEAFFYVNETLFVYIGSIPYSITHNFPFISLYLLTLKHF